MKNTSKRPRILKHIKYNIEIMEKVKERFLVEDVEKNHHSEETARQRWSFGYLWLSHLLMLYNEEVKKHNKVTVSKLSNEKPKRHEKKSRF